MSDLLRNLITVLVACLRHADAAPLSQVICRFWVTPFNNGIAKLKSDAYLQLAEAAQMVQFKQPITMFSRVTVHTQVVFADGKWVYFAHDLQAQG